MTQTEHQWKPVFCPLPDTRSEVCSHCGAEHTTTKEQDGNITQRYFPPDDGVACGEEEYEVIEEEEEEEELDSEDDNGSCGQSSDEGSTR